MQTSKIWEKLKNWGKKNQEFERKKNTSKNGEKNLFVGKKPRIGKKNKKSEIFGNSRKYLMVLK